MKYNQFYIITSFLCLSLFLDYAGDRREGINQSVSSEVSNIFKGKTTNQLLLLQDQMKKKLQGGEGVDVGE